jgi:hypothetical protein
VVEEKRKKIGLERRMKKKNDVDEKREKCI